MSKTFLITIVICLACVAPAGAEPASKEADASIQTWVRQLDSARFSVREKATYNLIQAGPNAIDAVSAAVRAGSLEASSRGLTILREIALQDNVAALAAEQAIEQLAEPGATAAAQRARAVHESLDRIRTERGVRILKKLGVAFNHSGSAYNEPINADLFVTFGPKFRGGIEHLEYLRWLTDFDRIHITLQGDQVDDPWLAELTSMQPLVSLQINRTRVTDQGLRHLLDLQQLELLSLRYTPLSDDCLEFLHDAARQGSLRAVHVYGTGITPESLDQLAAEHEVVTRYRRGGFLGVSGKGVRGVGCFISTVQPDQAAARAGIRPGDIVVRYGEHRVTEFSRMELPGGGQDDDNPTLAELIGADPPGTRVTLHILRGEQELAKEIVLGEWP